MAQACTAVTMKGRHAMQDTIRQLVVSAAYEEAARIRYLKGYTSSSATTLAGRSLLAHSTPTFATSKNAKPVRKFPPGTQTMA
jgi:hypothetical protein